MGRNLEIDSIISRYHHHKTTFWREITLIFLHEGDFHFINQFVPFSTQWWFFHQGQTIIFIFTFLFIIIFSWKSINKKMVGMQEHYYRSNCKHLRMLYLSVASKIILYYYFQIKHTIVIIDLNFLFKIMWTKSKQLDTRIVFWFIILIMLYDLFQKESKILSSLKFKDCF